MCWSRWSTKTGHWASRLHVAADGMLKLDGHGARMKKHGMHGFSDGGAMGSGGFWVHGVVFLLVFFFVSAKDRFLLLLLKCLLVLF